MDEGYFANPFNITFTLNYDGALKFKSSTMQIWPVQLCINELLPILQYKATYVYLASYVHDLSAVTYIDMYICVAMYTHISIYMYVDRITLSMLYIAI